MTISQTFKQLRDDIKTWATNNFLHLDSKVNELEEAITIPPQLVGEVTNKCLDIDLTSELPGEPYIESSVTDKKLTLTSINSFIAQ